MKKVEIKNKVVARGGGKMEGTSTAKGASVDLSGYLLKQIWEKVFEFRTTDDGDEYLFAKMNLAVQYGISSFVDGGKINLPGLYDGIPFDNRTIWMNPETGLVEVLVQGGEGGGTADFSNVISSGSGNAFTSFSVSGDGQRLTLVKGETFALQSDLEDIDNRLTAFLEGSDTNTIIDKWRELEDFLSGLRESDNLSEILSDKADKATTLAGYGITNAYTKNQVDDLLNDKADAATTLAGYGIADAYTKKQVDDLLSESVVPEELPNPFSLSWSGYSSGSYDGSSAKSIVIPNNTNQLTNGAGFITGITKTMVTDALGFTPYNATNPNGFIEYSDIPTRNFTINGSNYSIHTTSGAPTGTRVIYAAEYAGTANQVCVSGGSGSAPSWVNQSAITSGACSGNAATATKVLVTGSASNGDYRVIFSDMSAGTSANNSLYVDSVNEGLRYNPSTNRTSSLSYMAGATGGYYIHNTDYRVYADSGEFIINTPTYFSLRIGGKRKLYMNSSGWIGIGNSDPSGSLHINQSAWNNGIILNRTVSGGGSGIAVHSNGTHIGNFGINGSKEFEFSVMSGSSANVKMTVDSSGNGLFYGGITMYSDERKKTILNHVELSLKEVADAPIIEHYYNSDEKKTTHVGSIAQYWAGLNDWFCKKDDDGFYTMEIQNAAIASAISVARELMRYESKTDKQIRLLKKRICELEDEIETLKGK